MKAAFAALSVALISTTTTNAAPLEPDALYTNDWTQSHAQDLADDASMMILRFGYRCESISAIRLWLSGRGFTVICNDFRYEYELEDRGGNWVVSVQ